MKCDTYIQKTYTRTTKLFTFNIKKKNNLHYFTCYRDNTHTFNQRKRHIQDFKYKMSGYSFDFAVQNFSFTFCFIYIAKLTPRVLLSASVKKSQ